jgi:hypothetical protein
MTLWLTWSAQASVFVAKSIARRNVQLTRTS